MRLRSALVLIVSGAAEGFRLAGSNRRRGVVRAGSRLVLSASPWEQAAPTFWNPLNLNFNLGNDLHHHIIDGSFQLAAAEALASTATATATLPSSLAAPDNAAVQAAAETASNIVAAAAAPNTLLVLGNDLLIFLFSTIAIVPLFQFLQASPVLGFLAAGLAMGPAGLGLFEDLEDLESLAEAGVLFLLFEQGLELTVDRLRGLSKYAFGMGTLQVLLSTAAFFTFPFIGGVQFLEIIMGSRPEIVDITRFDEALVIGAALSLSSSAFVLKILQEKNQLSTRFGAACLGILLFQDIAVVPLLVLLPIIESHSGPMPLSEQVTLVGLTVGKAFLGLGGILVIGGAIVRYMFSLIAQTRSSETFVALVILTALGTGKLTDSLGLSSTLGAFTAGTLLAESNYRTQIESDIKPFRGLLLGLFFLTTGASVDPYVIREQWTTVIALLAGLIAFKTMITTALGPLFGLTKAESVRTGLLLSGGGEFAFVVLTLADKLEVLPGALAKVLVGVVVLSMAITPYLSELGDKAADYLQMRDRVDTVNSAENQAALGSNHEDIQDENANADVVVICGYGLVGEAISSVLVSSEFAAKRAASVKELKYVAFDLDPDTVIKGYRDGKQVLYGDGSQPGVLSTAGITTPRAFAVTYADQQMCLSAVERIRESFPSAPIFVRARFTTDYFNLREAGATSVVTDESESSLQMIHSLLGNLGVADKEASALVESKRADLQVSQNDLFLAFEEKKNGGAGVTAAVMTGARINEADTKFNFGRGLGPLLSDAKRQIEGQARRVFVRDDDISTTTATESEPSSSIDPDRFGLVSLEDDVVPGVDICLLPPRKSSTEPKK